MENVVIIGSGPAGLTAAIYSARALLNPLVIAGTTPGGQLTQTSDIENYPGFQEPVGGFDLMTSFQKQAERFGTRTVYDNVSSVKLTSGCPHVIILEGGDKIQTHTVIIATGASPMWLGLESEKRLMTKGVSACATCDGALPVFRDKPLVVGGGGDSACEEAMYLTRFGSVVYLVHRRDSLRASKIMADRVLAHPKIKPVWNSVVTDVLDVKQDKVTGVRLKNVKTGAETGLDCAGVFVAAGLIPNTELFKGILNMDDTGYIIPKQGASTNVPGVFVAGDCADRVYRQAVTAAGMGCAAAIEAGRYLAARNE